MVRKIAIAALALGTAALFGAVFAGLDGKPNARSDGREDRASTQLRPQSVADDAAPVRETDFCTGIQLHPTDDVHSAMASSDGRATFCFNDGEYRLTEGLSPEPGDELVFSADAVLSGAKRIADWSQKGSFWIAEGQDQSFSSPGAPCQLNPAACEYEDVFIDNRPLVRVLSLSALTDGTFFFDEEFDQIYLSQRPKGVVEAVVAPTAIEGRGVANVTVRGATIEKFGLHGIVTSDGWRIIGNEIRFVHSHGLRVFGDSIVKRNYIHHAGNLGIFGQGDGLVFEGNELAYNNYLRFGTTTGPWHAGAVKIAKSDGTIVQGNYSHDNVGDGWWFDWDNANIRVTNNRFERNSRCGLLYEASFNAVIRNNIFESNGRKGEESGGICISTSRDLDIANNTFSSNGDSAITLKWHERGVSETYGARQTSNVRVANNLFKLTGELAISVSESKPEIYAAGNRFEDNRYLVKAESAEIFNWNSARSWHDWQTLGHDRSGTILH